MTERAEMIKGIRELADFLERTPDAELPWSFTASAWAFTYNEDDAKAVKERMTRLAKVAGPFEKEYTDNYFYLKKKLSGGVQYSMATGRETVCERRVVGTKTVETLAVPEEERAKYMVKTEVEEVEWDCHPLLRPTTADE